MEDPWPLSLNTHEYTNTFIEQDYSIQFVHVNLMFIYLFIYLCKLNLKLINERVTKQVNIEGKLTSNTQLPLFLDRLLSEYFFKEHTEFSKVRIFVITQEREDSFKPKMLPQSVEPQCYEWHLLQLSLFS